METVARPTYQWSRDQVIWHLSVTTLGLIGIAFVVYRLYTGHITTTLLTILLGFVYYRLGLYSITFMHRYHAHEQFTITSPIIHVLDTLLFYSALQASIREWAGWHRQHHAEEDTHHDRTSPSKRGFWHAHMFVWMRTQTIKPAPRKYSKHLDTPEYRVSMMFEPYYKPIAFFMAFGLPTLIAWIGWGDPIGGLLFGGFTRLLFLYHTTWCINSVMHVFGHKMEGSRTSATNSPFRLFIWLIVGEPNHGRHHKWPDSYRFGSFDPGARMIELFEKLGLVTDLKKARDLA